METELEYVMFRHLRLIMFSEGLKIPAESLRIPSKSQMTPSESLEQDLRQVLHM